MTKFINIPAKNNYKALLFLGFVIMSCQSNNNQVNSASDFSHRVSLKKLKKNAVITNANDVCKGQLLFKNNCNKCHAVLETDDPLQGIVQRLGENYIKLYLTKQDSLINAKDPYAVHMNEMYKKLPNSHNFNFTDEQLKCIIEYLKTYSNN